MALFKICKGAETNLPQTLTNGYCYFCTDTANFYIDYEDPYGALTRSKISAKYADKLRYTEDGNFVEIEPADVLTKNNYEAAIGVVATDKNGLMSSADKNKLDGIADGAEVNVQPDWNQNDETADDYVKNRPGGYYGDPVYSDIDIYNSTISDAVAEIVNPGFSFVVGNVYTVTIGDVSNTYTAFAETFQGTDCVSIGEVGLNEAYSAGGTFAAGTATIGTSSACLMICPSADVGKVIRITTSGITREAHKIPEDLLDLSEINTKIDVKIDEQSERCNKLQQDISDINSLLTTGPITFTNEKDQILIGEHYNREGFTIKMINNDSGYTEFSRNGLHVSYVDEDNLSINVTKSVISIGSRNNGTISMEFAPTDSVHGGPYFFAHDGKGNSTYFSSSGKIVNSKKLLQLADADVDSNDKATTIRGVKIPEQDYDAANKKYVDDMAPTMVVNVTVTDGVYTADKTSQEIASAVVNNKKNVVAVLCTGSEYNTLRCSYANLTDTTSQSVFIVWDHDSKTRAIMTISNDGTNDSITVNKDPFTMTIGIEQTTNEQGDAVYTSAYTADDIFNAISSHIVPVCMFENSNGLVFGTLSNYNASNGCFQFTTTDGSDCGVYYVNIYANGNIEVGKTSIPTYTEATTTESGLMSATDKVKLDGVASNAASVIIKTWTTADIA